MRRTLLVAVCILLTALSFAQAPDFGGKAQKEAMKMLGFMVGSWATSPSKRVDARSHRQRVRAMHGETMKDGKPVRIYEMHMKRKPS